MCSSPRMNACASPSGDGCVRVGDRDAELRAVAEQALELVGVLRRGDDEDVADAGEHQRRQRVVDHRLVVDRDQLLRDAERDRVQPRAGAAGQDDAAHAPSLGHRDRCAKRRSRRGRYPGSMRKLLVTGGAGFIGSNFVHHVVEHTDDHVTVLDKLTYAGNRASLDGPARGPVRASSQGDIADAALVDELFARARRGRALRRRVAQRQLAARPARRSSTRTSSAPTRCSRRRAGTARASTTSPPTRSTATSSSTTRSGSPRRPRTTRRARTRRRRPARDLLVRAWVRSFGVQATISNCSNNYGPYQHVEKFIPRQITNVIGGVRPQAVRRRARTCATGSTPTTTPRPCCTILEEGAIGETYLIGADGEKNNKRRRRADPRADGPAAPTPTTTSPTAPGTTCATRSTRPSCAPSSAGRRSYGDFEAGLAATIDWYRDNEAWWRPQKDGDRGARTPRRASDVTRVRQGAGAHETPIPGLLVVRPARARRHPRLVQGELAAREDDRARPARLRAGAEQHLVQRRTSGTTRGIHAEPWDKWVSVATGPHLRRVGRPARGAAFGTALHRRDRPGRRRSSCRAASATRTRRSSPTPRTPTSSTTTGRPTPQYTFLNLADETTAIAWPIPLDGRRDLGEGSRAPAPGRRDARHALTFDRLPRRFRMPENVLITGGAGFIGIRARAPTGRRRAPRHACWTR